MTTKPIPTQDLTGAALDWAVAQCEGVAVGICLGGYLATQRQIESTPYSCTGYEPSKNWALSGPIIEREHIFLEPPTCTSEAWSACIGEHLGEGETPLIAAMRCYVASKLGPTVDVPQELAQ